MNNKNKNGKNVLLDSDDEQDTKKIDEGWKQNVKKYTILSNLQIEKLESEFIKKRLKPTRNNIKKISQSLKIPFKRALDYFNNRFKIIDNKMMNYTQKGIEALEKIDKKVNDVWEDYLEFDRMIEEKEYYEREEEYRNRGNGISEDVEESGYRNNDKGNDDHYKHN